MQIAIAVLQHCSSSSASFLHEEPSHVPPGAAPVPDVPSMDGRYMCGLSSTALYSAIELEQTDVSISYACRIILALQHSSILMHDIKVSYHINMHISTVARVNMPLPVSMSSQTI